MLNRRKLMMGAVGGALAGASVTSKAQLNLGGLLGLPLASTVNRARWGTISTNFNSAGTGVFTLPTANTPYLLPLSVPLFVESADFTLQSNGQVLINNTGLYKVSMCVDWTTDTTKDIDLRTYGIVKTTALQTVPSTTAGTLYDLSSIGYTNVAVTNVPGSNSSASKRLVSTSTWNPGTINPGSMAYVEITYSDTTFSPGDFATANHTALNDIVIGPTSDMQLEISARVVS